MALPKRLVLQKTLDYGQTAREGILTTNYYFVADNVVPVSYTHLDVYKRQALSCAGLLSSSHTSYLNVAGHGHTFFNRRSEGRRGEVVLISNTSYFGDTSSVLTPRVFYFCDVIL